MSEKSLKPFRWAIFGTGFVACKFALGLRAADNAVAGAVVSRNADRAKLFASNFGVSEALVGYESVVNREDIDGIYIATPVHLHRDHALLGLSAGKSVLVEKPFALNTEEALDIVAAARSGPVFCMEALWTRFLPAVQRVRSMLESGAIGDVLLMTASFSIAEEARSSNGLHDAGEGSGTLLNRGVYPLSLAVYFLGIPDRVSSVAMLGGKGSDESTAITLSYDKGPIAQLYAGTKTDAPNDCWILGSRGCIHLHAPIYRPFRITTLPVRPRGKQADIASSYLKRLKEGGLLQSAYQRFGHLFSGLRGNGAKTTILPYRGNGYHYQADAVRSAVAAGASESSIMSLAESVEIMKIMDQVRELWAQRPPSR